MADTAEKILDVAEDLLQARGYHGFSYQDVADAIGIRKPSLYYHFASKAELGRALVARYRDRLAKTAEAARGASDPWVAMETYLQPMVEFGRTVDKVCLAGVVGAEYIGLPPEMQVEVAGFFRDHERWMAEMLADGRARGAFAFDGPPEAMARLLLSVTEGALMIKRVGGDREYFGTVIAAMSALLRPAP